MKLTILHRTTGLSVLTIFLIFACHISSGYSQVYKSVDDSGKITYSDKPDPKADEVTIREPNTIKPLETPAKPDVDKEPEPVTSEGLTVSITSPQNDTVIPNGLVPFTVSTRVMPGLREGHKLQLTIDGHVHSTSQGRFNVRSIHRGEHQLQVEVIDSDGKVLKASKPVKIFVYRPSTS